MFFGTTATSALRIYLDVISPARADGAEHQVFRLNSKDVHFRGVHYRSVFRSIIRVGFSMFRMFRKTGDDADTDLDGDDQASDLSS